MDEKHSDYEKEYSWGIDDCGALYKNVRKCESKDPEEFHSEWPKIYIHSC